MSRAPEPACRRDVLVVIPAFNEAAAIEAVVRDVRAAGHAVVVVDDGSRDRTGAVALRAGATVLRHPVNRGQGAAIQTGLRYAVEQGAAFVATFDADGQHEVAAIDRMVSALEASGADVALGSRFLGGTEGMTASRRFLLQLAIRFTTVTEGVRLTDAHNGLRVLRGAAAARIRLRHDGMAHASEFVEQIRKLGLRYLEVPVMVRYTEYSRAKGQSAGNSAGIILELLLGKLR